jgi:uncharacterized protein with PIN domain
MVSVTKKKGNVKKSMAWVCPNGHRAGQTNEETKICWQCGKRMHRENKVEVSEALGAKG